MKRVELYGRVRHAVMIEGLSQREAVAPEQNSVSDSPLHFGAKGGG